MMTRLADHQLHGELRIPLLDPQQYIDHLRGQGAGAAPVGPGLGEQGLEATAAVVAEPVADRLGGHPGGHRASPAVVAGEKCSPGLAELEGVDLRALTMVRSSIANVCH